MGAKQSSQSTIHPIFLSNNVESSVNDVSPRTHKHNRHHQHSLKQKTNSKWKFFKSSSENDPPHKSSSHHHKKKKKSNKKSTNSPIVSSNGVVDQTSFNSIPTHLSSSSEDVYCDSSNCSTVCGMEEDIQSCNSINSSTTSSLDESCEGMSSSIGTDGSSINPLQKHNTTQTRTSAHHSRHPHHHLKAHEANQSYPIILPSHEHSKKQAFETNQSSFPHKSFEHASTLRRIQSERSDLLLNPLDYQTQPSTAQFPTSTFNNTPRFKSNKVCCISRLNSEMELEVEHFPKRTCDTMVSEIRNPQSQNNSNTVKDEPTLEHQLNRKSSSLLSLFPHSQESAFASYHATTTTGSDLIKNDSWSSTRSRSRPRATLSNKSMSLGRVVVSPTNCSPSSPPSVPSSPMNKSSPKMSDIHSMYVSKTRKVPTLSQTFSIPLLTVTRASTEFKINKPSL